MNDIKLLQLTDCHLPLAPEQMVRGYSPDKRLQQVVNALESSVFDHLLLTGDLSDPADAITYRRLLDVTSSLALATHWIPGNHDDRQVMAPLKRSERVVIDGNWAIVLLDSTFMPDGRGSGALCEEQLMFLRTLDQLEVAYILVVMHHPAFTVESSWQDAIKLSNAAAFWQSVQHSTKLRAVLCGHLHQQQDRQVQGVRVLSSPAVTAQFKRAQVDFTLEDDPAIMGPAYREIHLCANGEIDTRVVYLPL